MLRTISTNVDIDVELGDFDTDDLIKELEGRGWDCNTQYVDGDIVRDTLTAIWLKRRQKQNFDADLDYLIYYALGKII